MTRNLFRCLTLSAALPACLLHADLVLVDNGQSLAPIVLFADAPPFTRLAAEDLATYMEKTTGVRPELIEGQPDPLPDSAIWVGHQPILDQLFPDLDFDFQHPEEILIAANEKHLVIAGRDRWDPEHVKLPFGRQGRFTGMQQEYGTANAVYTFLQDYLDVRWLWPGELGEDVLPRETLAFAPFAYRYHPQFFARGGAFIIYMLNRLHDGYEWTRFQRLQLDSLQIYGGHLFRDWWERYHEDHPDYFALQPDGTRGGGKNPWPDAQMVKLCKANPAVWQQWLANVEDELERDPTARVFYAVANDGAYEGYCICKDCLAWDHPEAPQLVFRWRGLAQTYVSMTDRQITFANTLGHLLRERYPDKDYYVMAMAYGASTHPPVAVVPDDNVLVSSVHSFHRAQAIHPRTGADQRQLFIDYAKVTDHMIWRPNIGQGGGWHWGGPNVAPRRAIEDMQLVADQNVIGLWFDSIFGHWANQGPHYYLLAQMAWNPRADGEAILADFMHRAYGPAAEAMTAYWDFLEQATLAMTVDRKPEAEVWDATFHRRAGDLLDQAEAALDGIPEKFTQRVAFARAGMEYMRLWQANEELTKRWQQSGNRDTEARDAFLANWDRIEHLIGEHSLQPGRIGQSMLVNHNYVNRRRAMQRFGMSEPAANR